MRFNGDTIFREYSEIIEGGLHFEEVPMLETVSYLLYYNVFFVSVDGFSKDISFDEVPEAIQKIALREIGDVPIRDVDREKEDGETVYDIEAKDDSIDIELEITDDGTFREKDVTEKIAFWELPIPVQDTVRQQVGTLKN